MAENSVIECNCYSCGRRLKKFTGRWDAETQHRRTCPKCRKVWILVASPVFSEITGEGWHCVHFLTTTDGGE